MTELITSGPFEGLKKNHYRVIEADPPWLWKSYSKKGEGKSPSQHYSLMTIPEICEMGEYVMELAAPDCALFLWSTWPTMPAPWDVMKAWGFRYSGLAWEWMKYNPRTDKFAFGPGLGGTRKNLEPVLLGRRGSPKLLSKSERDWIIDPVTGAELISDNDSILLGQRRRHSEKPVEAKPRMERLFDGPYIELFSRTDREGWDSWGDEAGKFNPIRRKKLRPEAEALI